MLDLKTLQYTCMIVMLMLAFFTFVSRYYVTCRNRQFEQSRWMVVVALMLLGIHYLLQMVFGWREKGDDVGVLFNLLFYSPAAILLSCSQLNIQLAEQKRWKYMKAGVISYILIAATIGISVAAYGSMHIGNMLYAVDALHFAVLLYYIWMPLKEMRKVQQRLDSELGNPADTYLRTMRIGLLVLCVFVVLSPLFILSQPLLFAFGPFALVALSVFIVCFTSLGFSLSEGVTEIVSESDDDSFNDKTIPELTPERMNKIENIVQKWRLENGYRDSNLTLTSFTRRIRISRSDFTAYLFANRYKSFRTWLSSIRVKEAQLLMKEHPEYSNEVVSMECGFSSRVYFQRVFKERTGKTPTEWKSTETDSAK